MALNGYNTSSGYNAVNKAKLPPGVTQAMIDASLAADSQEVLSEVY